MSIKKIALLLSVAALYTAPASATVGYLIHGYGLSYATAGAGASNPADATQALINPALFSYLDTHALISLGVLNAKSSADARGPLGNPIGNQSAVNTNFPDMSLGYVNSNHKRISFGFSFGPAGLGGKYRQSTIMDAARGGVFMQSHLRYRLMSFLPTISFKVRDNFSVGVSAIIGYADLKNDYGVPQGLGLVQTRGAGELDSAWGLGLRFGAVWHALPIVSFGASYATPTWFQNFNKYRTDLLIGPASAPSNFTIGTSWHITRSTDILLDFKYINFGDIKAIGTTPQLGGFGWRNTPVYMLGLQHRCTKNITMRLGYSYNRSPLPDNQSFANAITPVIVKNHFTCGLSYKFSKRIEGTLMGFFAPKRTQTDPGNGDRFSVLGVGTRVGLSEYGFQAAFKINC